jgi:hypothetical protein
MSTFDVVIPAYNARPDWLLRAVCSAFACERPGLTIARNRGIESTTANWILLLDADDELVPTVVSMKTAGCPVDGLASTGTSSMLTTVYWAAGSPLRSGLGSAPAAAPGNLRTQRYANIRG